MPQMIQQLPQVLTMTIADVVHRDSSSGKFFILGTYNTIAAQDFPCVHPIMGVYLALTDGRGKTPLTIRLIDAEEEREPLLIIEALVDFPDPTQVVEVGFSCQRVEFPQPGEYRLELFAAGEPLLERRLFVMSAQQMAPRFLRKENRSYS